MRGTPIRNRCMNAPVRQAVIHQVDCPEDTLESMDPPAAVYQLKACIPACRSNCPMILMLALSHQGPFESLTGIRNWWHVSNSSGILHRSTSLVLMGCMLRRL